MIQNVRSELCEIKLPWKCIQTSNFKPHKKFGPIVFYCELTRLYLYFQLYKHDDPECSELCELTWSILPGKCLQSAFDPIVSIVNWQDFTSIFSCTNTMIQNVLNFVNAIWVKFCHARFLNALKGMLATQEWPSTAMLRHFIKPTVANVCATRAHLFAQNPLKVILPLSSSLIGPDPRSASGTNTASDTALPTVHCIFLLSAYN